MERRRSRDSRCCPKEGSAETAQNPGHLSSFRRLRSGSHGIEFERRPCFCINYSTQDQYRWVNGAHKTAQNEIVNGQEEENIAVTRAGANINTLLISYVMRFLTEEKEWDFSARVAHNGRCLSGRAICWTGDSRGHDLSVPLSPGTPLPLVRVIFWCLNEWHNPGPETWFRYQF